MPTCKCGQWFVAPTITSRGGRPRTRCDRCRRGSAGLDRAKWAKLRKLVLAEQPVCAVVGCRKPSTQVDHIRPLSRGGAPYDRRNLQGMCARHNSQKSNRMPGDSRRTTTRTEPKVPTAPEAPDGAVRRRCLCSDPETHGCHHGVLTGPRNTPTAEWEVTPNPEGESC